MEKFQRATTSSPTKWREFLAFCRSQGLSDKALIKDVFDYQQRCEDWINDTYHVAIDKQTEHAFGDIEIWHLSIKRHDREPIGDWRVMQEIKNLLVGDECEALELYPKESRLVDTANQYHLYAFPNGETVPLGMNDGRAVTDEPNFGKAKNRPREKQT